MSVSINSRNCPLPKGRLELDCSLYLQIMLDSEDVDSNQVREELGMLRERCIQTDSGYIDEVELTDTEIADGTTAQFTVSGLHYTDLIRLGEFICLVGLQSYGISAILLKGD